MKLQHWLVEICYVPGEKNSLADALSCEERTRRLETDGDVGHQSGVGGCGGKTPRSSACVGNQDGSTRDEVR